MVLSVKAAAFFYTHSAAVLSDALESIVNVVAAIVAFFVIRYVSQPADKEHPYGHGKMEYFSSAFEGGLIFAASLMILVESVKVLLTKQEVHELETGMVLVVMATSFNLALSLYLKKIAKAEKSEALSASAAHVMSDVVTTGGVLIGLVLVRFTGWLWIDALIAVAVGIHLAWEGVQIVRRSIAALIDETDTEVLKDLSEAFEKNRQPGIIDIHQLRVIRSGKFHHVDAHLVIPEFWTIEAAHTFTEDFEERVVNSYSFDGEIAFHLDPCDQAYCKICDLQACPIRSSNFVTRRKLSAEMIVGEPTRDI